MLKQKLKPYSYSENGTLKEIFVCSPTKYNVSGPEVSSVGFKDEFVAEEAYEQHLMMKSKLENFGCIVRDVNEEVNSPLWNRLVNRMFIRDVGAVLGHNVLLGNSGNGIREPDFHFSQNYLRDIIDENFIKFIPPSSSLEFGDFLILTPECVLINTGHRSNNRNGIANFLFSIGVEEIGFVSLPQTIESLHLDVVCNVFGDKNLVAAPLLKFSAVEIYKSSTTFYTNEYCTIEGFIERHGFSVYWLPNKNCLLDYTNFINLDKQTVLISNKAVPYYQDIFPHIKYIGIDVTQLQHGAGSIRCLTMPFIRE
ncbi:arginine deiminase family protein [Bacillus infantis]|uniref:Amidinotransferase n=1 Tax=Bacillus infantis TaxID=324767 RepID=A0A5D4RI30_9BACI|nr:arginine deiminase family protein [Bacillus infantis]TYS51123.1 hypothetical protein FZD51_03515 [Bacillus infantis]